MSSRWLAIVVAVAACKPAVTASEDAAPAMADAAGPDAAPACQAGHEVCIGPDRHACIGGELQLVETCEHTCVAGLGCVACEPNTTTGACVDDHVQLCAADGSGYLDFHCDPVQGMTCSGNECVGACAPGAVGSNYIGCDYYPTATANMVEDRFAFAIALSNTSDAPCSVQIEGGALAEPITVALGPGEVQVRELPWVEALRNCELTTVSGQTFCQANASSVVARGGAYRVRSTQPITLYQFNPLHYHLPGGETWDNSYTNDASLLLPANALTGTYYVASWPTMAFDSPGLVAITAAHDDTDVTLTPEAAIHGGPDVEAAAAGEPRTVRLSRGDVLQVFASAGDLTGSLVSASKPVQVIGGHFCAFVPSATGYCDHLEEVMFPAETLGTRYLIVPPAVPTLPFGKVEAVRIVATAPDTTIVFDPPQPGVQRHLEDAGDSIDIINNRQAFEIRADRAVLVVQYMEGQEAGGNTGDPAMALTVPVEQFRRDYQFHAPLNYEVNYVNIVAPLGATITLDGDTTLGVLEPIGDSDFGLWRAELPSTPDGTHHLVGDRPFGVSVYGYGQYTSYWYPGGLDLTPNVVD